MFTLKKIFKVIKKSCNKEKDLNIITIDGITCAGKSYFADLLKSDLQKTFSNVFILSKDLFLLSRKQRIKIIKKMNNRTSIKQNDLHYDLKKIIKVLKILKNHNKKRKVVLSGLYNRKTGNNNMKIIFNFKKKVIIIFEGLYVLDDLKSIIKPTYKVLIINNIYNSLIRKIQRIRDKKISIQNVVTEFTNLHIKSFNNYLFKNKFDISIEEKKNDFIKISGGRKNQIKLINKFKTKHLFL